MGPRSTFIFFTYFVNMWRKTEINNLGMRNSKKCISTLFYFNYIQYIIERRIIYNRNHRLTENTNFFKS